ncbi:hypothetical protein L9F63_007475, partial [Diploptera punctata]
IYGSSKEIAKQKIFSSRRLPPDFFRPTSSARFFPPDVLPPDFFRPTSSVRYLLPPDFRPTSAHCLAHIRPDFRQTSTATSARLRPDFRPPLAPLRPTSARLRLTSARLSARLPGLSYFHGFPDFQVSYFSKTTELNEFDSQKCFKIRRPYVYPNGPSNKEK